MEYRIIKTDRYRKILLNAYSLGYATRDQQGGAIKSTYVEVNGENIEIFKDPITDNGVKKSAKGLIAVYKDMAKEGYVMIDQVSWYQVSNCEFKPIYSNGKFLNKTSLKNIREKLDKTLKNEICQ